MNRDLEDARFAAWVIGAIVGAYIARDATDILRSAAEVTEPIGVWLFGFGIWVLVTGAVGSFLRALVGAER